MLTGGDRSIVTGNAGANHLEVVDGVGGRPQGAVMAILADLGCLDVCRPLAGSGCPVVARCAGPDDLQVIDGIGRRPQGTVVAVLADLRRLDMGWGLARCLDAIMATNTAIDDAIVREVGRGPGGCRVAAVAFLDCRDVSRVLAGGGGPVVTGRTGTDHLEVIDRIGRRPQRAVVAVLTDLRRLDMGWGFARCLCAVVATDTAVDDAVVAEVGR